MPTTITTPSEVVDDTATSLSARNRQIRQRWIELEGDPSPAAAAERGRLGNEIASLNQGLVRSVWVKYRSLHGADDDLLAAGNIGLWEAFLSWDPDQAPFANWCWRHIDGRIRRQVASDEFTGSYLDWTRRPQVAQATAELRTRLDRDPTAEEIASATGLTAEAVQRTQTPSPISLDLAVEQNGSAAEEYLCTTDDVPAGAVDDIDTLREVTSDLTPAQLAVLLRTRGFDNIALDGGPVASIREAAALLGYNREGMRERLATATQRLRDR